MAQQRITSSLTSPSAPPPPAPPPPPVVTPPPPPAPSPASPSGLTVPYLQSVIRQTNQDVSSSRPPPKAKKTPSGAQPTAWFFVSRDLSCVAPLNHFDEVYPGIYLGDEPFARDKATLKTLGITHLLNAAQGQKFNQIDTSEAYYADLGLVFMGVRAMDVLSFKMKPHFRTAADFIHNCLQSGGKVAVHCHMGRSRSASLVLAYLMVHQSLPLVEALKVICQRRAISPNSGFLKQLIQFEEELRPSSVVDKTEVSMTGSGDTTMGT